MERKDLPDAPIPALAVRQVEESERAFFAGYYAERRYNPTGWRLRLQRDARVLCAAAPGGRLGRVLSVGCGDGEFELMLASRADSVLGVDISPEAIEIARSGQARAGVRNVEFRCLSVVDLALSERFDTVVCVAFLHHLPAAALPYFLEMSYERLRPGGLFYSQDPSVHGFLRFVGRRVLGANYDKYHSRDERELDPVEVTDALARAGFTGISVRYIDVSLIPALYFFRDGPDVILHACAIFDRLWCATPLARWASGFSVVARRSGATRPA
jgi:SAM-dependent methyltransferase